MKFAPRIAWVEISFIFFLEDKAVKRGKKCVWVGGGGGSCRKYLGTN